MKQTVSRYDFVRGFVGGYADHFSYDGKLALFDYLEELEESTGSELEYDPVGLCCDFFEYDSLEHFQSDYSAEDYPDLDTLRDYTEVIPIAGTSRFIIHSFWGVYRV